ncbi:hypothetical protein ABEP17_06840 [Priestia flexa]|uniref:hypothetical protein n=1 Tax=Priestia flexa TaxID=86664 RepID=UPI003D2BCE69
MSIIHDYLYDTWNEHGVVEDEETIQRALEHRITHDEALEVPSIVEQFIRTINANEGRVEFEGFSQYERVTLR